MIAIIDYKAGNLRSVERALKKLGAPCSITRDRAEIANADRIIFPGVGAAGSAMKDLKDLSLDEVLRDSFLNSTPIMGICLGTQIILESSQENSTVCLGLLKGEAKRIPEMRDHEGKKLKIPHMGWNRVDFKRNHPVFEGIRKDDEFYFVHSYYPSPVNAEDIIGETEYGILFPSVIGSRNLVAMQFHPEKSGTAGLKILGNFCKWDGHAQ